MTLKTRGVGKNIRRTGIAAAAVAAPLGLAYRFALAYRVRAGYPRRNPPHLTPADVGLPFESMVVESEGVPLPAWFIPARDGAPGPAVVLVHGWESARDRTLPLALFLHAAGFHTLTFDVRGHGANPPEPLPLSAGEFGADTLAAFRALAGAPRGDRGGRLRPLDGRHRGDPGGGRRPARQGRRRHVGPGRSVPAHAPDVPSRAPADPRCDRLSPGLADDAGLRPAARPPGRRTSARRARSPGTTGRSCSPTGSSTRSCHRATWSGWRPPHERPGQTTRPRPGSRPCWSRAVSTRGSTRIRATAPSWPGSSRGSSVARWIPTEAAERAEATNAERIPDIESAFAAIQGTSGGLRTLASVALPGATRPPRVDDDGGPITSAPGAIPAAPTGEP